MVIILQTIKELAKSEIEVKKSRFIGLVFPISDVLEVKKYLDQVKKEYKGANHYCYAYRTPSFEKYDDDKEPSKTAGYPLLELLTKKDLTNVLAIVIRYFGGIKLGAGGLIRSYQKALKEALNQAVIVPFTTYVYYELVFSYENEAKINKYLKDLVVSKEYADKVKYTIKVATSSQEEILENIAGLIERTKRK